MYSEISDHRFLGIGSNLSLSAGEMLGMIGRKKLGSSLAGTPDLKNSAKVMTYQNISDRCDLTSNIVPATINIGLFECNIVRVKNAQKITLMFK